MLVNASQGRTLYSQPFLQAWMAEPVDQRLTRQQQRLFDELQVRPAMLQATLVSWFTSRRITFRMPLHIPYAWGQECQ